MTELKEDGSDLETDRVFLRKIFLGLMLESFIIVVIVKERCEAMYGYYLEKKRRRVGD